MSPEDFLQGRVKTSINSLDEANKKTILDAIESAKNIDPSNIFDPSETFKGDLQQGDILLKLPVLDMGKPKKVKEAPCVLLSNACDLVRKNKRGIRITYSPVLKLDSYVEVLKKKGEKETEISGLITNIKKQLIPKILFIPQSQAIPYDGIVVMDFVLSASLEVLLPDRDREKDTWAKSMSVAGWYVLVSKLTNFYFRPTDDQLLLRLGVRV